MKVLFFKLFVLVSVFMPLCSCVEVEEYDGAAAPIKTPVGITADCSTVAINCFPAAATVTRAADAETNLEDVNIYLFNTKLNIAKHYYVTVSASNRVTVTIPNGEYRVYIVGNYGRNLGEQTLLGLVNNTRFSTSAESGITNNGRKMPMSAQMSVVIDRNTTLQVPLERLAAKVTFNISMSPAMAADSRIVHLQMYNCTGEMGYFQKGLMGPVGNGGIESYTKFVPGTNAKSVTRSYYVLENMQGTVSRITTPRQRSRTNAPNRATYLWLRIERGMKFIDYRIYLGENDTNDFNVCRNTSYVYNVTVEGENSADLRVSTAKIVMYSNRPSSGQGDYNHFRQFVWEDQFAYCELEITTANNDPRNIYSVRFNRLAGGTFRDGWYIQYYDQTTTPPQYVTINQNEDLQVLKGNGKAVVIFRFWNGFAISPQTYDNSFLFTIEDMYGYTKQITVRTSLS